MKKKPGTDDREHRGGEAGTEQQRARRDRENMGPGLGDRGLAKNQGREGGRGTGRNGRGEKGDRARTRQK